MAGERALKYYTIEHSKEHSGTNLERCLERTLKSSLGEESMSEHIHATLMCSQYFFLIMRPWSGFHPIPQRVTGSGGGKGRMQINRRSITDTQSTTDKCTYISHYTVYVRTQYIVLCALHTLNNTSHFPQQWDGDNDDRANL